MAEPDGCNGERRLVDSQDPEDHRRQLVAHLQDRLGRLMRPELPIEVDADTGVWTTDGLPMLYVPRHFFTNNHLAVEAALGRERYAEILYPAGYKSAYFWCEKE